MSDDGLDPTGRVALAARRVGRLEDLAGENDVLLVGRGVRWA